MAGHDRVDTDRSKDGSTSFDIHVDQPKKGLVGLIATVRSSLLRARRHHSTQRNNIPARRLGEAGFLLLTVIALGLAISVVSTLALQTVANNSQTLNRSEGAHV